MSDTLVLRDVGKIEVENDVITIYNRNRELVFGGSPRDLRDVLMVLADARYRISAVGRAMNLEEPL